MKKLRKTREYYNLHNALKLVQTWLKEDIKTLETCKINEHDITNFNYELQATAILLDSIIKNGKLKNFMNKAKENN